MSGTQAERLAIYEAQIRGLRYKIKSLENTRNSLLPISSLPAEVLCRIFEFARDASDGPRYNAVVPPWIKIVLHVCHSWRETALSCPSFWSRLEFDKYTRSWMEFQLERAKSAAISILVDRNGHAEKLEHALHNSLSRTQQLKGLDIINCAHQRMSKYTEPLRGVSAPLLQRLVLQLDSPYSYPPVDPVPYEMPLDFFAGGIPALRYLDLKDASIPFASPVFRGLTSLKLKSTSFPSTSTPGDFFQALDNAPGLKLLDLEMGLPDSMVTKTLHTIPLRDLESFRLKTSLRGCGAILEGLALPLSSRLNFILIPARRDSDSKLKSEARAFGVAIQSAWLCNPLSQLPSTPSQPVVDQQQLRSLSFTMEQYEETRAGNHLSLNFWLIELSLSTPNPLEPAPLRISVLGPDNEVLPRVLSSLPTDQLVSVIPETDCFHFWTALGEMTNLQYLVLNAENAGHFFEHIATDKSLYYKRRKTGSTTKGQPENEYIPLKIFPKLVNFAFEGLDFSPDSCEQPEDWETPVSVKEVLQLMLRRRAHGETPFRRVKFSSCINLLATDIDKVKKIVPEVDWDKKEETRCDQTNYSDGTGPCTYCGSYQCRTSSRFLW